MARGIKTVNELLTRYLSEVEREVKENILPFWMDHVMDRERGGFYNSVTNNLGIDKQAHKGCILNSRILWTYSAAYRKWKKESFLTTAKWAYDFLARFFWDREYSGLYWMVDFEGSVLNDRKQLYNIAFGIYGLCEYYLAGGEGESLEKAVELYRLMEKYGRDNKNGGYFEAFTRDWRPVEDMRLSPRDMNEKKSMNTHLHLLEAYTALLRAWKDEGLRTSLRELLETVCDHIIDGDSGHFKLFFNEEWDSRGDCSSFGHDIEGSWLLYEAACALGERELTDRIRGIAVRMAESVLKEGVDKKHGGLYNEEEEGMVKDTSKPWWPQAEAMVGFLNAYQLTGEERYLEASYGIWEFVRHHLVDKIFGEWFWRVSEEGKPDMGMPKVEPWKCPYHNGRACLEVMSRIERLLGREGRGT